jgi:tetratricopeptide (TPR) repeat protein
MQRSAHAALWGLALMAAIVLYAVSQSALRDRRPENAAPELLVSIPRFAQVMLAGGDRDLAANLAGFRVLVAATERMTREDYAVQARLQGDIAWLNPAHEDNYYIAAAILPWNGHVQAAQAILRQAAAARPHDWQPLFYYGFGRYHFFADPAEGARSLLQGAERAADQQDRWALENMAARWVERGYQTANAAEIVGAMARNSPPGGFRKYLQLRADRLQDLSRLQAAAERYRQAYGRSITRLEDLVGAGYIERLPSDPLKFGFGVDDKGTPILLSNPRGGTAP